MMSRLITFAASGCLVLAFAVASPRVSASAASISPASVKEQNTVEAAPRGELWPLKLLADDSFAVSTRALALRREVRMYQWQAETGVDGSVQWSQVWSGGLLKAPPALRDEEHRNPASMPFRSVVWRPAVVELDGHPVDSSLYAHFEDWTPLPVDVATLPPNLAASFASVDGCLHSGVDVAKPLVGDLRICWEVLPAGPIEGAVRLESGRWVAAAEPVARGMPSEDFALDAPDRAYWLLAILLLAFLFRGRGRG